MKKAAIILWVFLIKSALLSAQNGVSINPDGTSPHPSAMLDVQSENRGFLVPRMDSLKRTEIEDPALGLLVFDTSDSAFYYYNSGWKLLSESWTTKGNSGSNPAQHFLGTTDSVDFSVKTNNIERFRISAEGLIGINSTSPKAVIDISSTPPLWDTAYTWTKGIELPVNSTLKWKNSNVGATQFGIGTSNFGMVLMHSINDPFTEVTSIYSDLTISNKGYIGINNLSPVAPLDISLDGANWTNANWKRNVEMKNVSVIKWGANSNGHRFGIGQNNNGFYVIRSTSDNNFQAANYHLFVANDGKVGINTTSPDQTFSVNGTASKTGGGTWDSFSDIRLKTDTAAFTDGLNVLKDIRPMKYKFNGIGGFNDDKEYIGVIAQQVQNVAPYTITQSTIEIEEAHLSQFPGATFHRNETTYTSIEGQEEPQENNIAKYHASALSYNSNAVIYMLVNAVKELSTELEIVKQRLQALEQGGN